MATVTKIYKGYTVRLSDRKKGCMSFFGYISIVSSAWRDVYVLNHEIGHERQRAKYGNIKTLFKVYIPSIYGYWCKNLSYEDYYKQPWEAEANKLGTTRQKICDETHIFSQSDEFFGSFAETEKNFCKAKRAKAPSGGNEYWENDQYNPPLTEDEIEGEISKG